MFSLKLASNLSDFRAISWMEDPLKLIREEYRSIFMTELAHLVKDELKDESRLY